MGNANLNWKEKLLQGGEFSKLMTMSDEVSVLFVMRDYDKINK